MYQPVNRAILVEPETPPEQTESGILLPAQDPRSIQTRGIVRHSNSSLANPGDRVVYGRVSPATVPTSKLVGAPSLLVIYERDLVAVDNGTDQPFPIPADDK